MRRPRKLIGIVAGVSVLVLVLVCGALALVLRSGNAPVALAPQAEVEQRVVQFAQDSYGGTVTAIAARATTKGEVDPQRCSFFARAQVWVMLQREQTAWDWCDNTLPMWHFTLQGEFRSHNAGTISSLQIITMPDGNPSIIAEGP